MKKGYWMVVRNIIRKSDIVLEILDARFPDLTRIWKLEQLASVYKKPVILVINKADIVSEATLERIEDRYKNCNYVIISAKFSNGVFNLIKKIKMSVKAENPKVAVIGYPNTGKSSLINRISKGGRAPTSSVSGCTRGLQLISGKGHLKLFDTPGVVPFSHRDDVKLGLVSGISPSKLKEPDIVSYELINLFKRDNPSELEKVYGISESLSPEEFLVELGKKWNMLMKGGVIDETRAAVKLLSDWHNGKIRL